MTGVTALVVPSARQYRRLERRTPPARIRIQEAAPHVEGSALPCVVAAANRRHRSRRSALAAARGGLRVARVGRARARLPARPRAARRRHRAGGAQQGLAGASRAGLGQPCRLDRPAWPRGRPSTPCAARARAARSASPPYAPDATPFDPQARRAVAVQDDIRRALDLMTARRRRAVALDLQGFTPEEIARAAGHGRFRARAAWSSTAAGASRSASPRAPGARVCPRTRSGRSSARVRRAPAAVRPPRRWPARSPATSAAHPRRPPSITWRDAPSAARTRRPCGRSCPGSSARPPSSALPARPPASAARRAAPSDRVPVVVVAQAER